MIERHTDLPPDRQAAFEDYAVAVREAAFDQIRSLLDDVQEPALAQRVYELAFAPNDVFPQRSERPDLHSAVLSSAAADAVGLEAADREALLAFTVAIQEYYDVLDDLIDGDVADGHETEAQLVAQVLLPLAIQRLDELGSDAIEYWTTSALELVTAPYAEASNDPGPSSYREVVDRQSVLFGFQTGLAAVADGRDASEVSEFESLGRLIYKHDQFVRDVEQHVRGDEDPWNAAALIGQTAVVEQLRTWRSEVEDLTTSYSSPAREHLRALVALDVDDWQRELGSR